MSIKISGDSLESYELSATDLREVQAKDGLIVEVADHSLDACQAVRHEQALVLTTPDLSTVVLKDFFHPSWSGHAQAPQLQFETETYNPQSLAELVTVPEPSDIQGKFTLGGRPGSLGSQISLADLSGGSAIDRLLIHTLSPAAGDVLLLDSSLLPEKLHVDISMQQITVSGEGSLEDYEAAFNAVFFDNGKLRASLNPRLFVIAGSYQGNGVFFSQSLVGVDKLEGAVPKSEGTDDGALTTTGPIAGSLILDPNGAFAYSINDASVKKDQFCYEVPGAKAADKMAVVTIASERRRYSPRRLARHSTLASFLPFVIKKPTHGEIQPDAGGGFAYAPSTHPLKKDRFVYEQRTGAREGVRVTLALALRPQRIPHDVGMPGILESIPALASTFGGTAAALSIAGVAGSIQIEPTAEEERVPDVVGPRSSAQRSLLSGSEGGGVSSSLAADPGPQGQTGSPGEVAVSAAPPMTAPPAPPAPPLVINTSFSGQEDAPLSGSLGAPGGSPIVAAVVVTPPMHGVVDLQSNGDFTFTPEANYAGPDSFVVELTAQNGAMAVQEIVLSLTNVNDDPVAEPDDVVVGEDGAVIVNPLSNDSDVDGDSPVLLSVTDPANGTATILPNGTIRYTPDPNFAGIDSFDYTIGDGNGGMATATVTVTVDAVNDDPTAEPDSATVGEDGAVIVNPLSNDSDVDGDSPVLLSVTDPANGKATILPNGTIRYTPDPNFSGIDTFDYTIGDGNGGMATATVTVTVDPVNDDPVAGDEQYVLGEDSNLNVLAPGVLGNDSDVDMDALVVDGVSSGPSHGQLTLNADGSFTYTPDEDYHGHDSFEYTVSDQNGGSDTGKVKITVNSASDIVDDKMTLHEDQAKTINVLANDSFGPNAVLTGVTQGAHGMVTFLPNGQVTYDPSLNFNGSDNFDYTVTTAAGNTETGRVTVCINPVNDAPEATDDHYMLDEGGLLNVPAPGVLTNDMDVDGDTLGSVIQRDPYHGTVEVNADGSFSYTPDEHFSGHDSFTYRVSDPQGLSDYATVKLHVNPLAEHPESFEASLSNPLTAGYSVAKSKASHDYELFSSLLQENDNVALELDSQLLHSYEETCIYFNTAAISFGSDGFLYIVPAGSNDLSRVDPSTGEVTTIQSIPWSYGKVLGLTAVGDVLYGAALGSSHHHHHHHHHTQFFRVLLDGETPVVEDLGTLPAFVTGLTYDAASSEFYAVLHSDKSLFRIDGLMNTEVAITKQELPVEFSAKIFGLNALASSQTVAGLNPTTGAIHYLNPLTGTETVVDTAFGVNQFLHYGALGVAVTEIGGHVAEGQAVAVDLSAQFSDIADGSENHYFLVQIPDASWAAAGQTLVTDPTGFDTGVYIKISAAVDGSGAGSAAIVLEPSLEGGGLAYESFELNAYAVAEEAANGNLASSLDSVQLTVINELSLFESEGAGKLVLGSAVNDTLIGSAQNDLLIGLSGDDVIQGGPGNDIHAGGPGHDTHVWLDGDQGTLGSPAVDHVADFDHDTLDLSGLLQDEESHALELFLSFDYSEVEDATTIDVSPEHDGPVLQQIVLDGTDLTVGGTLADAQIIDDMLGEGELAVDA